MIKRRQFLQAGSGLLVPPWLLSCSESASIASAPSGSGPAPRGVHVSWTADPHTTRTITWFTDGAEALEGVVEYGQGGALDKSAIASQETAFDSPVVTHRAQLTGFDPEQALNYRVRNGDAVSAPFSLRPLPRGAFRFAHFGDHGMTEYSRAVRDGILARGSDFVLIAGDLSYANGDQLIWDQWFDQCEHLLAQVPTLCCPGNHEDKDGNGAAFRTRFSQPGDGTFYSFDYERVHFMVSTGGALISDGTLPEELLRIETDLALAALRRAAGEIDFIVFLQHFTIWTDEEGRSPANPTLIALEEHIMLLYGVDLLLVGHDHGYQRSKPMGLGLPLPFGYTQVCGGAGGVSMRSFSGQQVWGASQQRRYSFIEYAVEAGRIVGTTYAVDAAEDGPPTGVPVEIDRFEVITRSQTARNAAVHSPRGFDRLLADAGANWRYVEAHTKLRNASHLHQAVRKV
jgi:hypothetical protein